MRGRSLIAMGELGVGVAVAKLGVVGVGLGVAGIGEGEREGCAVDGEPTVDDPGDAELTHADSAITAIAALARRRCVLIRWSPSCPRAAHLRLVRNRKPETRYDRVSNLSSTAPQAPPPQRTFPRHTGRWDVGSVAASVRGRTLADYPDLLLEWAWDVNAAFDPAGLAADSHELVA